MRVPKDHHRPCPNRDCPDFGKKGQKNIRAISTYQTQSGKRRILECKTCKRSFSETQGTVFFDLRAPEDKFLMAIKLLVKRMDVRDVAEVLKTNEDTVLKWLRRAEAQCDAVQDEVLQKVDARTVELDELWTFVKKKWPPMRKRR